MEVWYLLVNGYFQKPGDWDAEGGSAPFPHTNTPELCVPANSVSILKSLSLVGLVNHCQPLLNQSAEAKILGREITWLKGV